MDPDDLTDAQQRMLGELREHRTIEVSGRNRRTAQALVDGGFAEPVRVDGGELSGIRLPESLVAAPEQATPTDEPEPGQADDDADDAEGTDADPGGDGEVDQTPRDPHAGMRFHPTSDPDAVWRIVEVTGERATVRYGDDDGPADGYARASWVRDNLVGTYL